MAIWTLGDLPEGNFAQIWLYPRDSPSYPRDRTSEEERGAAPHSRMLNLEGNAPEGEAGRACSDVHGGSPMSLSTMDEHGCVESLLPVASPDSLLSSASTDEGHSFIAPMTQAQAIQRPETPEDDLLDDVLMTFPGRDDRFVQAVADLVKGAGGKKPWQKLGQVQT